MNGTTPPAPAAIRFEDIRGRFREGPDYRIVARPGRTGALVMAPHGGGIEPGTRRIAEAVAGGDHGCYAFIGRMASGNRALHLASTRFDEPRAMALAAEAAVIVVIHGCRQADPVVYLGGRDGAFRAAMARRLAAAGVAASVSAEYPGVHPRNLCNRFPKARGIQMEFSTALRDAVTVGAAASETLRRLADAVRGAMGEALASGAL